VIKIDRELGKEGKTSLFSLVPRSLGEGGKPFLGTFYLYSANKKCLSSLKKFSAQKILS
jgi:hypothetical protein